MSVKDAHLRAHRDEALVENARFLLEQGEPFDHVAKRLGVTEAALEKAMERHK